MKYNYEVSVNENRAKLNKDIFLFRGNRNIHYYFSIKGARFAFKKEGDLIENANAIYAAVTVIKPNGVEVANAIAPVENGLIHLKVTEDLIDEEVEVGDFDLVFDLFDDTDGAVTIPKVIGQFHVLERPCTTPISELVATNTTNEVDQALTDYAIVTYAEPVASTNADGTFAKKTWVPKEKITTAELNRMEEGISDVNSQIKENQVKLIEDDTSMEGISDTVHDTLDTDDKRIIGGINEVNRKVKDIANENSILYSKLDEILEHLGLKGKVTYTGRWFTKNIDGDDCMCTINSGSELYFKVKNATKITIETKDIGTVTTEYKPYIRCRMGNSDTRIQLVNNITEIPVTTKNENNVRIIISAIRYNGKKWSAEEGLAIKNISTDGTILTDDVNSKNQILFLGDSITEGQLITAGNFSGLNSDKAFPHLVTDHFTDYICIQNGFGGTGMLVGGNAGMPVAMQCLTNITRDRVATYDYDKIKLIVINYGTNDVNKNDAAGFKTAYKTYIEYIKSKFTNAKIIILRPCTKVVYEQQITEIAKEENVYLCEVSGSVSKTDSVHPNEAGHKVIADSLIQFMQDKKLLTSSPVAPDTPDTPVESYEAEKQRIENAGGYYRDFSKESSTDSTITLNEATLDSLEGVLKLPSTYTFKSDGVVFNKDFISGTLELGISSGDLFCLCLGYVNSQNKFMFYYDSNKISYAELINNKLQSSTNVVEFLSADRQNYTIKVVKNNKNITLKVLNSSKTELCSVDTTISDTLTGNKFALCTTSNCELKLKYIKLTTE